jgi:glycosyltransferase involved in cell wall biosynthesis
VPQGPRISVIVPVRNRRALLGGLFDALDAQTWRDFETVVVDDGSNDGSGREARRRGARVLTGVGNGAVAARCAGAATAIGDALAFTDSDCRPRPGWLTAVVAELDDGADVVHGPTVPERPPKPRERSVWSRDEGLYPTCNITYRRHVYDQLGGFDGHAAALLGFRHERRAMGLGFGEDTLLAWRARRAGFDLRLALDAVVEHHVFPPDLRESLSRAWMAGAFPALVREVPELRETLVRHGFLFGPRSRLPVYATTIALVARRPLAVGVSVGWWGAARWRDLRRQGGSRRERVLALPEEMLLDVVVAVALLTGGIRARMPLA